MLFDINQAAGFRVPLLGSSAGEEGQRLGGAGLACHADWRGMPTLSCFLSCEMGKTLPGRLQLLGVKPRDTLSGLNTRNELSLVKKLGTAGNTMSSAETDLKWLNRDAWAAQ